MSFQPAVKCVSSFFGGVLSESKRAGNNSELPSEHDDRKQLNSPAPGDSPKEEDLLLGCSELNKRENDTGEPQTFLGDNRRVAELQQ